MKSKEEILRYFPNTIYCLLKKEFDKEEVFKNLHEIRLHSNKPIILKFRNSDMLINYKVNQCEILQILERICNNSIYAYKNQICNGFITIKGGHRVGITGTAVVDDNEVINMKDINSLNFRIAREIKGVSNKLLDQIVDKKNDTIYNTLIVSPPGKGKTTILRDLIRRLSDGIPEIEFNGKTCRSCG